MKKQHYLILIPLVILSVFLARIAFAANVSFELPSSVNTGENIDVIINTNTDGIAINSVEFIVNYDEKLLSYSGYSDDNAIIKLWIDPPHMELGKYSLPTNTGEIHLSGIIPGGVNGLYDVKNKNLKDLSPMPLVHLLFKAKNDGTAKFYFINSKILENDGLGTPLLHEELQAETIIKNNPNYKPENITQKDLIKEDTNNTKYKAESNLGSDYLFYLIFWIVILIIVSSIIVYKLIKYKL